MLKPPNILRIIKIGKEFRHLSKDIHQIFTLFNWGQLDTFNLKRTQPETATASLGSPYNYYWQRLLPLYKPPIKREPVSYKYNELG